MAWWQGFPGWFATTVLAGIGAVAAVATVVLEVTRRRRERKLALLVLDVAGTATVNGRQCALLTLWNHGNDRVLVDGVWVQGDDEARLFFPPDGSHRVPQSLGPGEHVDLLLEGGTEGRWAHLMFHRVEGKWLSVTWAAFDAALKEELGRQMDAEIADAQRWRVVRWLRRRPVRYVGPGGTTSAHVGVKVDDAERKQFLHAALGL